MKTTMLCLLFALAAGAAERPAKESGAPAQSSRATGAPAQSTARRAAEVSIPKDAVETEPGFWRWTDPAGRKWVYRRTPFGLSKFEEGQERPAPPASKTGQTGIAKAEERGDMVAFEQPGPFGPYRWQRRKSELNEAEKAAWERSRTKAEGGANSSAGANTSANANPKSGRE